MTKPAEVYACLYATEFPAQALLRLRPDLRDKPCVVMEGEPPLQQVCSLTRRARSLGMAHGMTQVEVDTFPAVTVLHGRSKEEAAAKASPARMRGRILAARGRSQRRRRVSLCASTLPEPKGLFGPPETLARNLLTRVQCIGHRGLRCRERQFSCGGRCSPKDRCRNR